MPYVPLRLGSHVSAAAAELVRSSFDPLLSDFRFLMTITRPDQGAKGSLQRPLTILVMCLADSAAQLLFPSGATTAERFKGFMGAYYPWDIDPPNGMTRDEAIDFLWDEVRAPIVHRMGLRAASVDKRITKFGRNFSTDDQVLMKLEESLVRPFSVASIERNETRAVIWIDSFYWALRIAISKAFDTPEKCEAVIDWIKSGAFDPKARRRRGRGKPA